MTVVLSRLVALLTLLTTLYVMGDAAQILCFGEDGHVALERFAGSEHLGAAASGAGHTIMPAHDPTSERVHVDVSVGETAPKNQMLRPIVAATTVSYIPTPTTSSATWADPSVDVEAPPLRSIRTTVLRT